MSETKRYHDADGNKVTLTTLCKKEPDWAANQIRRMQHENEELRNGNEHIAAWMDRCHKLEIKINELQHILNNIQIVDGRLLITGEMRKYVKPLKESEVEGDI